MNSFDFARAERHLMRAIELEPSRGITHEWLVTLLLWTERPTEALAHAELALELNPLSPTAHAEVARALLFNGRCEEALELLARLEGVEPPLLRVAPLAAQCYAVGQMWAEAIAAVRPQAMQDGPSALAHLGYALARSGQREEAIRVRTSLLERFPGGEGAALHLAVVSAGLGDLDEAFSWLERAPADRSLVGAPGDPGTLIIMSPLMVDLRRDPRFERIRELLGLRRGVAA
jgi:tetratricopeptide (TPR) repeat protein